MRGFRFLSFYYSSLYSNRRAYTVLDHWCNSFKTQMFNGLKCYLWTYLERISCYVSTFRSKRCVDLARRDNCCLQQYDYYSGMFCSVVAKTTVSNLGQVGTWSLSLAFPASQDHFAGRWSTKVITKFACHIACCAWSAVKSGIITRQVKNCMTLTDQWDQSVVDAGRASTVKWSPKRVVVRDSGFLSSSVSFANPYLEAYNTESRDRHALSRALSKTWPMCSHWPYRGECHIFLYFG